MRHLKVPFRHRVHVRTTNLLERWRRVKITRAELNHF